MGGEWDRMRMKWDGMEWEFDEINVNGIEIDLGIKKADHPTAEWEQQLKKYKRGDGMEMDGMET